MNSGNAELQRIELSAESPVLRRPPLEMLFSALARARQGPFVVRSKNGASLRDESNTRHDRDRTDRRLESATVRGGVEVSQGEGYRFVLRAAIAACGNASTAASVFSKGPLRFTFRVVHNATNLRAGLCVPKTNN